jgi:hypothetical protein
MSRLYVLRRPSLEKVAKYHTEMVEFGTTLSLRKFSLAEEAC